MKWNNLTGNLQRLSWENFLTMDEVQIGISTGPTHLFDRFGSNDIRIHLPLKFINLFENYDKIWKGLDSTSNGVIYIEFNRERYVMTPEFVYDMHEMFQSLSDNLKKVFNYKN